MIRYEIQRIALPDGEWIAIPQPPLKSKLAAQRCLNQLRRLKLTHFAYRLVEIDETRECRVRIIQ